MTPEEFITALFGEGWMPDQLPVFLTMLAQAQEDAKRYHEVRERLAFNWDDQFAGRSQLCEIDRLVDSCRANGLI